MRQGSLPSCSSCLGGLFILPFSSARDRTETLCAHRQFVDPQRLFVREQAGAEVRGQEELVELHVGEIGRAQDHVGLRSITSLPSNQPRTMPSALGLSAFRSSVLSWNMASTQCHRSSSNSTSRLS